jgi:hypothetical protein
MDDVLLLKGEAKIRDLLGDPAHRRLEASGVVARDGAFYVIFDNSPHVARIDPALSRDAGRCALIKQRGSKVGYEDIAYDAQARRFHILVEALPHRDSTFMARVRTYDEGFRHLSSGRLDFRLPSRNKGLEGLTCVRRDGRTYLLGLCEGNRCKAGAQGRRPGGGRIQVFVEGRRRWEHAGTIRLPEAVRFEDYSSLAVDGVRVAVVSQASSELWVGAFEPGGWDFAGDGVTHRFPRDHDGRILYGNVEGVSWSGPDEVVVVSDRAKPSQPRRCRAKDRSIHVFAIPPRVSDCPRR